jgi:outer membrane immunogenic protein
MKMQRLIYFIMLLASACLIASTNSRAQINSSPMVRSSVRMDASITYSPERARLVAGSCCFWMHGGSADIALTFWRGFGVASSVTGEHASNISTGVDVNTITFLSGPRYTYNTWSAQAGIEGKSRAQFFGQALFGGVHGFNGVYPAAGSATTNASSFAMEAGGGINLLFSRNIGLRIAEVEYVRTALPNGGSNSQTDFRLSFGIAFHR